MYKVLLVEDEIMVRQAIAKIIKWEEIGFTLVGEANDGEEALDFLNDHKVDLVLTDICMPFMDGLDLSRAIQLEYPEIKVAVITGHNEFEYAQKALEYNVIKYILKPLTAEELTKDLLEIKDKLDVENFNQQYLHKLKKEYRQNQELVRNRFLRFLLEEKLNKAEIENHVRNVGIHFVGSQHAVVLFKVRNMEVVKSIFSEEDFLLINFAILNIVGELLEGQSLSLHCFHHRKHYFAIIASKSEDQTKESFIQELGNILDKIVEKLKIFLKADVAVGIGQLYSEYQDLHYSYQEAKKALEHSHFTYEGAKVHIKDLPNEEQRFKTELKETKESLLECVQYGKREEALETLDRFEELLRINKCSKDQIRGQMISVGMELINLNEEATQDSEQLFMMLYKAKTLERITEIIKKNCENILERISKARLNSTQQTVKRACQEIHLHYGEPEYGLGQLCQTLYLSSSYLSKIFKRETGETFKSYLTNLRMEKAKDLLITTELKTYEISERVGYKDPHYFSYLFRKHANMTAKAFRQREA